MVTSILSVIVGSPIVVGVVVEGLAVPTDGRVVTSILSVTVGSPVVVVVAVGGMAVPTDELAGSVLCVVVACFGLVDTGG